MAHNITQSEWEDEMSVKILDLIQNVLYLDFRYLDQALSALTFAPAPSLKSMATDGIYLYFSSEQILRLYPSNPLFLNRSFLHSVLHCIFRHLWLRKKRVPLVWNLACDIAVEYTLDHLEKPSVKRILSWTRMEYYKHLEAEHIPITAAAIYQDLLYIDDPLRQQSLQHEFYTDDHRYWPRDEDPSSRSNKAGQSWENIGRRSQKEMEARGQEQASGIESFTTQIEKGKSRRSYAEFLKKFTVLREELQCDYDEFDLNYYTYGLNLYKNMPLIEPIETKEIRKILEFAIVIDTSYSTNGVLVEHFLKETYSIISQKDQFFRKSKIHIIQCDNRIQSDHVITTQEEMDQLLKHFELKGGGGTDFRPAFSYINELVENGELKNLKGVLYFTDGKGIFPKRKPDYSTAFLFLEKEETEHIDVPPWAMKLVLEKEEFL